MVEEERRIERGIFLGRWKGRGSRRFRESSREHADEPCVTGNKKWRDFWESKNTPQKWSFPGKGGDEAAKKKIEEVYASDVGEEYKERLSCIVEGREFTGVPVKAKKKDASGASALGGGGIGSAAGSGRSTPIGRSGGIGGGSSTQKEQNETFFAKKGAENASRPEGLKPSEGGKYAGFGSGFDPADGAGGGGPTHPGGVPGVDDFQKDPIAALGKGWGWFSGQAAKVGKGVYEGGVFAGQKVRCLHLTLL